MIQIKISIHAPHAGSEDQYQICATLDNNFNPRSPCGERIFYAFSALKAIKFQSTLPMRGANDENGDGIPDVDISIHAPHAGSESLAC